MRLCSFTKEPFNLSPRTLLQTTGRITTRSGAVLTKSISKAAVSQAANLMIGLGPSANYERSPFSHKTGIVFSGGIAPIPETEIEIQRTATMERRNQ